MEVLTLPTPLPHLKRVEGPLIWESEAKTPTSPLGQGWVGMSANRHSMSAHSPATSQYGANMAQGAPGHQILESLRS